MSADGVDVAVLGAGPAGLGAAFRLAASGHRVVVLERAPRVGGLAGSFEIAGVRVDHGSHRLHPSTPPAVLAVLQQLLGDDLQPRGRNGRICLADRFVAFPPRASDLARTLPPRFVARVALDAASTVVRRQRDGRAETFADAVRARLGNTMLREFYSPFAHKLFGVPAEQLDPELARRRISARSSFDILRRAGKRERQTRTFFYPRRGFGQIVDALAHAAEASGACIETGATVTRVGMGSDRPRVTLADGRTIDANQIWSTLPLPVLAALADAPAPVCAAANALEYRGLVLVYLVLERPHWTPFDAHYFPSLDIPMSRMSEPTNYRASVDDPPDRTVLCAEVPCTPGDAVWEASPDALAQLVEDGLARARLPAARAAHVEVRRVPRVYPVYKVGYGSHFDVMDRWVSSVPWLLSLGRQGLFAHDNTHHALAMAWEAAAALHEEQFDATAWADARRRFRLHVVED